MKTSSRSRAQFVVCIDNGGYEASRAIGKLCRVLPDMSAERHGYLRIDVPRPLERALLAVS
jgi:hypothetical protein